MANTQVQTRVSGDLPFKFYPRWETVVVSPLLYSMVIPLLAFDLCLEFYHRVAFPLLGIQFVPRRAYVKIDRHRLPYLPLVLKVACAYCGYANGVLQYAARIAGDTEAHFCPIKHKAAGMFHAPPHHKQFAQYGDAPGFVARWRKKAKRHEATIRELNHSTRKEE